MRYKNLIIKCTNEDEFVSLQRHLFKYNYSWYLGYQRHRQIKRYYNNFYKTVYVIIDNDDSMIFIVDLKHLAKPISTYKQIDYKQMLRKDKLKKINNVQTLKLFL